MQMNCMIFRNARRTFSIYIDVEFMLHKCYITRTIVTLLASELIHFGRERSREIIAMIRGTVFAPLLALSKSAEL